MSEHRLSEIVIERPRGGMRISAKKLKGYRKELNQITQVATEDGLLSPYLIKTRRQSKWLSDHLGPLRKLLQSQVGQPWDQVYSRLCRDLNPRTMAGQHVIDHLWAFVEQHVEMIDGLPYTKQRQWHWNGERPSLADSYGTQFYVHPETGLLCVVPKVCRRREPKPPNHEIEITAYEQYRQIENIWYRITFEVLSFPFVWDMLLKEMIDAKKALQTYGRKIYAAKKRQCSKRDLKKVREML
ncbi:hypothetical protein N836_26515 [Leptolyngbya sp. Heron Island J]|uniref:hypothetical protein n=1 Tax=Leptolyngbya sp. Heron Island J TaxID=1385935 RepID=UPI0003B9E8DE|nr:hypothetical protein [Leptolyngbya sp. Heron Island J]ESA32147.1 hypothetical protein N836_26515 [Leptolyngbya sp. Heron Island J]